MRIFVHLLGLAAIGSLVFFIAQVILANLERDHPPQIERPLSLNQIASWPKTPDYNFAFNALDPLTKSSSAGSEANFDPNDDFWGLPRAEGYELVDVYCSGCHSLQIVMQQTASKERWRYMLRWMSENQNMPPLPADDERIVINYLATHFGPR